MKMQVGVVGKQKWDMEGEDGKRVRGMKIFAFDGEYVHEENREGVFLTSFNLDADHYNTTFAKVPGHYELDMSMRAGSKGVFTVTGAKYVGEYKI